ncbi:MAG: hypothetical protein KDJ26_06250 [Alphaproteobacteria bacterium]|nr:hypothetical protein [Alphaproteobacteria bacterium]MCB1551584.1 hypothetical protein [Alphaproteobacteria bacterium]MCB9984932.1 hypothetical protein [Micavibrio sp.]HPQ50120.1 hypothetical protein [Alphaproteobacteria bacterium]
MNTLNASRPLYLVCSLLVTTFAMLFTPSAMAQSGGKTPALVITNQPLPATLAGQVYTKPVQTTTITPQNLLESYYGTSDTMVSRKIGDIHKDLGSLQQDMAKLSERILGLEKTNQSEAAGYYASTATISTQLQSGTTPGNPRLLQKLANAQDSLDKLARNVNDMNELAIEITKSGSVASYLLEGARSAYGLTGAVEEDHVQLAQLEDSINNTIIIIDRLQNNINDDITRTSAYLATERNNLRTMSLAVSDGNLLGKSLSSRPFTSAAKKTEIVEMAKVAMPDQPPAPSNPRPLVKIRFDRENVDYEQPVYIALNEAMEKFPDARFELVAVYPSEGNAAQAAIESTKSRRNAERVLRSMTQMGLPMDKVDISYAASSDASSSEVHIYVR